MTSTTGTDLSIQVKRGGLIDVEGLVRSKKRCRRKFAEALLAGSDAKKTVLSKSL